MQNCTSLHRNQFLVSHHIWWLGTIPHLVTRYHITFGDLSHDFRAKVLVKKNFAAHSSSNKSFQFETAISMANEWRCGNYPSPSSSLIYDSLKKYVQPLESSHKCYKTDELFPCLSEINISHIRLKLIKIDSI